RARSRPAALGGEEGRASGGVCQPAADSGGAGEEVVAAARGEDRTELRAFVRNRRAATGAPPRPPEYFETVAGARGGVQLGRGDAKSTRQRNPAGPARPSCRVALGPFAAVERCLGAAKGRGGRLQRTRRNQPPTKATRARYLGHHRNCHFHHGLLVGAPWIRQVYSSRKPLSP